MKRGSLNVPVTTVLAVSIDTVVLLGAEVAAMVGPQGVLITTMVFQVPGFPKSTKKLVNQVD
mgnify:CR=1 FL=1